MSRVFVSGLGSVSPAGWGTAALCAALETKQTIPSGSLARPGWEEQLQVRPVPPPTPRPVFLTHPRLRRASAISQYALAAALEALGDDVKAVQSGATRLGIVMCVMAGPIGYCRKFFEEVVNDPSTASPLVFPETVFNAPASHLAAYLNTGSAGYTLVGDDGTFLQGVVLAADWLADGGIDGCLVVGAEEIEWVVADALRLFSRQSVHSGGAGALYLRTDSAKNVSAELTLITDAFKISPAQTRADAAKRMRRQFPAPGPNELLCPSMEGTPGADEAENAAWSDWDGARLETRPVLGQAFGAATAWQCVAACSAVREKAIPAANVSVVGVNQQAIGARFEAA